DRKNKAAIVVDAILWKGLYDTEKKIVSPPPYYMLEPYLTSIEKIEKLHAETFLTGHYDPIYGDDIAVFLRESKQFVTVVEEAILQVLQASDRPLSLEDILHQTNELAGPFTEMMVELVGPICVHLEELETRQTVKRNNGSIPTWELV